MSRWESVVQEGEAGRNHRERIESLQHSLKSAFDDMLADLARAEREKKKLIVTNKKLEEELKRAKEGEVSSKQSLEQTSNKQRECLEHINNKVKKLAVKLVKRIKEQEEARKTLEEELKRAQKGEESSRKELEQTRDKLQELRNTFAAVKEQCDRVCHQQGAA